MDLNAIMISQVPPGGYGSAITLAQMNSLVARRLPDLHLPFRRLVNAFCEELRADDVPGPEYQPLTFACVWTDLARLTGVEPPAEVAALAYGDALFVTTTGEELLAELITH